jgi:hypothetical protein
MATLTRNSMIENIKNDDAWLSAAVLRIATMHNDNALPFTMNEQEGYNIDYWSGWIRSKRSLSGSFRDNAIEFLTTDACADCLWQYVVSNNKGDNK